MIRATPISKTARQEPTSPYEAIRLSNPQFGDAV
jgi:hypothetical protein